MIISLPTVQRSGMISILPEVDDNPLTDSVLIGEVQCVPVSWRLSRVIYQFDIIIQRFGFAALKFSAFGSNGR